MRIRSRAEDELQGLSSIAYDVNTIREVASLQSMKGQFHALALSSTSKISTMFSIMSSVSAERKVKRRALVDCRLSPDASTVAVDDTLHNGQAHARAFVLLGAVQSLKHVKEFADVSHIKAHTVVLDKIDAFSSILPAANGDDRHFALTSELKRVGKQVDKDLLEQARIGLAHGQLADRDVDAPPRLLTAQCLKHLMHEVSTRDAL